MTVTLEFSDAQGYADFVTLVRRGRSADADAAVRLVTRGAVLGVWAGVLPGSGLFAAGAAVGHRGFALVAPVTEGCDVVVSAGALTDRFARDLPGATVLSVPPAAVHAPWAGQLPLTGPWEWVGSISESVLAARAAEGIASVAQAVPDAVGSAAVDAVRRRIWDAPLPVVLGDGYGSDSGSGDRSDPADPVGWSVPTGAAFAASVLGLLPRGSRSSGVSGARGVGGGAGAGEGCAGGAEIPQATAQVYRCGRWSRIRLERGHVFARA